MAIGILCNCYSTRMAAEETPRDAWYYGVIPY